jgi:spore coat polysaccharide biosynthesis protein SpsF (cytidylyltransferase family)
MSDHVVGIIQARCDSTRLKNKVLANIEGKPLIERIYSRVKQVELIDQVVIATTNSAVDNVLTDWCIRKKINVFRGSEQNVLERFYECAKLYSADIIVRITADDPFKDSIIINHAVDLLIKNNYDYVSNTIKPTFPEGIDVEVFRFDSLKSAFQSARLDSEKEHVTPYIWKNIDKFSLYNFEHNKNISHLRWTIDYPEDLEFARAIYKKLQVKNDMFYMQDVLSVLDEFPELLDIQKKIIRNEGYLKSIEKE